MSGGKKLSGDAMASSLSMTPSSAMTTPTGSLNLIAVSPSNIGPGSDEKTVPGRQSILLKLSNAGSGRGRASSFDGIDDGGDQQGEAGAEPTATEKELDKARDLRMAFDYYDVERVGYIDPRTLQSGTRRMGLTLTEAETQNLFDKFVDQGMPKITFKTLSSLLSTYKTSETDVEEVFRLFDIDSDGVIGLNDLETITQGLGYLYSTDLLEEILIAADVNKDGLVTRPDVAELFSLSPAQAKRYIGRGRRKSSYGVVSLLNVDDDGDEGGEARRPSLAQRRASRGADDRLSIWYEMEGEDHDFDLEQDDEAGAGIDGSGNPVEIHVEKAASSSSEESVEIVNESRLDDTLTATHSDISLISSGGDFLSPQPSYLELGAADTPAVSTGPGFPATAPEDAAAFPDPSGGTERRRSSVLALPPDRRNTLTEQAIISKSRRSLE